MVVRIARTLLGSWLFRLTATVALLGVVIWRSDPQRVAGAFGKLGVLNIVAAAVLTIPFLYLKSLRWFLMLRQAGTAVSFSEAAVSLVGGMGLALITPARVGEVVRAAYLPDGRKLRLSALVMLDKFFDVLVLVLLAIAGGWKILGAAAGVALLLAGLAGLLFAYRPRLLTVGFRGLIARSPEGGRMSQVFSSLEALGLGPTTVYIVITLGAFLIVIAQFGILLHGAQPRLGFDGAALTFPMVILTNVVPLTIAGLGIREGASILLLGYYHVPRAISGVAAFMMFFVNTGLPGVAGAVLTLFRARSRPDPRPRPARTPAAPRSDA